VIGENITIKIHQWN